MGFLFCADPLRAGRPDPAFAEEVALVRAGGAAIALLDHDALLDGDTATAVARVERNSGPYWYRGWMIPADAYHQLEQGLNARGCALLTGYTDYRRAHEFPGWYRCFADLTPRSVWLARSAGDPPSHSELAALGAPLGLGAAVVKDYVKSRKHEWDEACFVPDLGDHDRFAAVVGRLFALQGDSLTGGVVVRAFEPFVPGGEARVWWVDGAPVLVTAHPDTPGRIPTVNPGTATPAVRALGCRFVTTDLALRADGRWRVVEVGDGQVSGLPAGTEAAGLFAALALAGAAAAAPAEKTDTD